MKYEEWNKLSAEGKRNVFNTNGKLLLEDILAVEGKSKKATDVTVICYDNLMHEKEVLDKKEKERKEKEREALDSDQAISSDDDSLDPMYSTNKKTDAEEKESHRQSMLNFISTFQFLPQLIGYIPVGSLSKVYVCPCSKSNQNDILFEWSPYNH